MVNPASDVKADLQKVCVRDDCELCCMSCADSVAGIESSQSSCCQRAPIIKHFGLHKDTV